MEFISRKEILFYFEFKLNTIDALTTTRVIKIDTEQD